MTARREVRTIPRPWGETTCAYGKVSSECDLSATRHFMWLDDYHVTGACDKHADFLRSTSIIEMEEHTFGANCSMPGALWQHPYEDETEGYCVFPAPDDASVLIEFADDELVVTT